MEVHWAKVVELESDFDSDTNEWTTGFFLQDEFWSLDLCMVIQDDYFDGVIGVTNTSALMVKLLPEGDAAVVACVS